MDYTLFTSPQETVQFISIFNYLNTLSDFLFLQNYLSEDDQTRQIPVVNALYEYLEDHRDNKTMKLKLTRHLLKGSDLYGEEEDENVDVTFVNAMFEYIISSLVFDKYGNIYGYLADMVRKAKILQLNALHEDIITNLRSATFENEYGERSTLTSRAVNRIFTDIILPLFPQTNTDRYVLSLDYIYAQAGSIFLRPGRLNTAYYSDYENHHENANTTFLEEDYLFDEYVTAGIIMENLLFNMEITSLQAFSLPALFLYVCSEFDTEENIRNLIFNPSYWIAAYKNLFLYLRRTFNKIKNQLQNDNLYQMHTKFLTFQSSSVIAEYLLNLHCRQPSISKQEIQPKIFNFLKFPEGISCNRKNILPIVSAYFKSSVKGFSELYKKHDLKSIHQSFENCFFRSLENTDVIIHLLAPSDNVVQGVFDNVSRLPYDLFEFYYPENNTADFIALIRENYTTTFIKESDGSVDFIQKTGLTVQTLLNHRHHRVILKLANQTMNEFWNEFMAYKQLRLESYLQFSDKNQLVGEWWKEFGLALVPFYPRITRAVGTNYCTLDNIKFLDQFDKDVSSLIIEKNTQQILSLSGTSIETIFLKNLINKEIGSIIEEKEKITLPLHKETYIDEMFEKLSLQMEESGLGNICMQKEVLTLFSEYIDKLRNNINHPFRSIQNIIYNLQNFKNNFFRKLNFIGTETRRVLYIKYLQDHTGYGYKFIHFRNNTVAQLRSVYEQKTKLFVLLDHIEPNGDKIYLTVSNDTFEIQPRYIYEMNNRIQSRKKADLIFRILAHDIDEKSDSKINEQINLVGNARLERFIEKKQSIEECVEFALSRNANLSREQIFNIMDQFTFPDENRTDMHFIDVWTSTADLKIPEWSKHYVIENPALLSKLRYKLSFYNTNLSNSDGKFKINSIYTFRERQKIQNGIPIESIVKDFNDQKERYVVTFEDYYALRNFATTGYRRITSDTSEARLMKTALYKLAIRQSDEPDEEFNPTLFRIESKPIHVVNTLFFEGNIHILQKFSTTFINETFAINSAKVPLPGYKNILYEMKFAGSYFRAKIRLSPILEEKEAILLPGTKFTIVGVKLTRLFKLGECLKVTLVYQHRSNDKYEWYKSIMNEISRITS